MFTLEKLCVCTFIFSTTYSILYNQQQHQNIIQPFKHYYEDFLVVVITSIPCPFLPFIKAIDHDPILFFLFSISTDSFTTSSFFTHSDASSVEMLSIENNYLRVRLIFSFIYSCSLCFLRRRHVYLNCTCSMFMF